MNTIKYLKPNPPSIIEENTVWSKEDEEMFVKIGEAIDSYYAPFSSDAEDMSNWFKSLKQRYIWKPTTEQMETIEEKAEAYDAAIVRAKAMIKVAANQDEARGFANTIFPELKESESEKVKKEILEVAKTVVLRDGTLYSKKYNCREWIAWLEKQDNKVIDCSQNHQDSNRPNGCIVFEDFNGGEGFYKLNLDYLNKKQLEEIEEMVRTWNKESEISDDNIKNCIGMCLTDVNEQRFKDYNTNLKDCLAWLEKQGENHANIDIDEMVDKFTKTELKFDSTLCAVVDAYRKGITDALIKQNLL